MAIKGVVVAFFFFSLVLAKAQPYTAQLLKGSVTCLDCPTTSDLSGVQILVKCDKVKKLSVAYTEEDGNFQTNLPSDGQKSVNPSSCMAKIMGGSYLLYVSARNSIIPVANARDSSGIFTTSKPLSFYKSCPLKGKCQGKDKGFASSKTVDLPLPREWGLAPSSYYIPFFPIIGIP
ncbi:hypothetical protein ACS0TY_020157 [Phlomoides rotata]